MKQYIYIAELLLEPADLQKSIEVQAHSCIVH